MVILVKPYVCVVLVVTVVKWLIWVWIRVFRNKLLLICKRLPTFIVWHMVNVWSCLLWTQDLNVKQQLNRSNCRLIICMFIHEGRFSAWKTLAHQKICWLPNTEDTAVDKHTFSSIFNFFLFTFLPSTFNSQLACIVTQVPECFQMQIKRGFGHLSFDQFLIGGFIYLFVIRVYYLKMKKH